MGEKDLDKIITDHRSAIRSQFSSLKPDGAMPPKLKVKYYLDTSICKQEICFDPKCAGLTHFPLGPVGYIKNESRADQSRYVPATGGSWLVQMDGGKNRIC